MKKLLIIFLSIVIFLPLYAQDGDDVFAQEDTVKERFTFERQRFEMGFDFGAGVANDIIGRKDIFTKDIIIDMNDIEGDMSDDGINLSADFFSDFFLTIKKIRIGQGKWDIGFFSGGDGEVSFNLPKNLVTLIAKGNSGQSVFDGMISARGGVYANAGFDVSAEYGKLRVGVRHLLYTPLLYIPKSGINYHLDTSNGVDLTASGDIEVYSPFITSDNLEFNGLKFGFNFSTDGTYALFPFLDVGGSLINIPLVPAKVQNRMKLTLSGINHWGFNGQDLVNGEGFDELDLDFDDSYDSSVVKVYKPFRFDAFARYKPFNTELFSIIPNIGFTVDINDSEGFFNAGLALELNIRYGFILGVGMGRVEGLWKHQLDLIFNLRAFELALAASLQSQGFRDSFRMSGFGFGLGISFGW